MTPISGSHGFLTVTDLNDFNGPAQTTNLGVRSSNLFGRAILPPLRIKLRTRLVSQMSPGALNEGCARDS
jgi:hypothetical protein